METASRNRSFYKFRSKGKQRTGYTEEVVDQVRFFFFNEKKTFAWGMTMLKWEMMVQERSEYYHQESPKTDKSMWDPMSKCRV